MGLSTTNLALYHTLDRKRRVQLQPREHLLDRGPFGDHTRMMLAFAALPGREVDNRAVVWDYDKYLVVVAFPGEDDPAIVGDIDTRTDSDPALD